MRLAEGIDIGDDASIFGRDSMINITNVCGSSHLFFQSFSLWNGSSQLKLESVWPTGLYSAPIQPL